MELIKFSHVRIEEATSLLRFLAHTYRLKIDVKDPLIYCNDYYKATYWPETDTLIFETIDEEEVHDENLPGYYTSFLSLSQ
jgi:hypothetical protein